MTKISAESLITHAPPSTMIYSRFVAGDQKIWETGLLIREDAEHIEKLPRNPVIEVRAGLFIEGGVQILAIMVKAVGVLYETWFNYHQRGMDTDEYLHDWATQESLAVIVYGQKGRERSIRIRNPLVDIATKAQKRLQQAEPWSMEDFDAARGRLYDRYPTADDLWIALGANT
jgi:hypothetical protein